MIPTLRVRLPPQIVQITMPDEGPVVGGRVKPRRTRQICKIRVLDYGIGYEKEGVSDVISLEAETV